MTLNVLHKLFSVNWESAPNSSIDYFWLGYTWWLNADYFASLIDRIVKRNNSCRATIVAGHCTSDVIMSHNSPVKLCFSLNKISDFFSSTVLYGYCDANSEFQVFWLVAGRLHKQCKKSKISETVVWGNNFIYQFWCSDKGYFR